MRLLNVVLILTLFHWPAVSSEKKQPTEGGLLRVATFNTSLNRRINGGLEHDLRKGDKNATRIATILRTVRPDIVLLNEFDYDEADESVRLFREKYLQAADSTHNTKPLTYPHMWSSSVNTGLPSGRDLDHDDVADGPADSFGFGNFPGQYGMVVLSRFPIHKESARTFQKLLWKSMPGRSEPVDPDSGKPWYSADDWDILRLSSKSHWDIPVDVNGTTIHFLTSHPTPPAFDGPEDRNGKRNADEIRFWVDYLSPEKSDWIQDDRGLAGGLAADTHFFVVGDLNADPLDGGSVPGAVTNLLNHPRVNNEFTPQSDGARLASDSQGKRNGFHNAPAEHDTSDFNDFSVGNLRVDYVLPSQTLTVIESGVFWPAPNTPGRTLIKASDHRLVWVDVKLAPVSNDKEDKPAR